MRNNLDALVVTVQQYLNQISIKPNLQLSINSTFKGVQEYSMTYQIGIQGVKALFVYLLNLIASQHVLLVDLHLYQELWS